MKTLIIYYSRTNFTKKIAEELAARLSADIHEVIDLKNRQGAIGFVLAGKDAVQKNLTPIKFPEINLADYDLVIIGTPVWAGTMAAAIRTILTEKKDNLKNIACFATQGGKDLQRVFGEIEKVIDKKLVASEFFVTKEIVQKSYTDKLQGFIEQLRITN